MKKTLLLIAVSLLVMVAIPWASLALMPSPDMFFLFILMFFLGICPLYSIILGVLCGTEIKKRWYIPVISAFFYLASMWALMEPGEIAFAIYSAIYLVLSVISMLITGAVKGKRDY